MSDRSEIELPVPEPFENVPEPSRTAAEVPEPSVERRGRPARGSKLRPDRPPSPHGMRIFAERGTTEAAVICRSLQIVSFIAGECGREERAVLAHVVWALHDMARGLGQPMPERWAELLAGWPSATGPREALPQLPPWYPAPWVDRRIDSTLLLARTWETGRNDC